MRGQDLILTMAVELVRPNPGAFYHAFLFSHSGAGKSTELTRLCRLDPIARLYAPLRFGLMSQLDPGAFQPVDVVLYIVSEVVTRTALPIAEGGAGHRAGEDRLRELWYWFATEKETLEQATQWGGHVEGGLKLPGEGVLPGWAHLIGLFGVLKGEFKYASARKKEVVEYRLAVWTP